MEKDAPRRRKLHILRFAFRGKSSVVPLLLLSPPNPLTLGFGGAPCPKAVLWILAFYTGVRRGDVPTLYVFALVQFTRFRPVRGVLRTASTDSCVLHELRRIHNTFRITGLICGRKSGDCENASSFLGSAARRGKGISDSAAADLIASNAPLREGRHTARPVYCHY